MKRGRVRALSRRCAASSKRARRRRRGRARCTTRRRRKKPTSARTSSKIAPRVVTDDEGPRRVGGNCDSLTSKASRSRTGVVKARSAGSAAASPVSEEPAAAANAIRSAHQPNGEDRDPRAVAHEREQRGSSRSRAASHRLPRWKARRAAAKAPISSASPSCRSAGRRNGGRAAGGRRSLQRHRRSDREPEAQEQQPKSASTAAT